MHLVQEFQLYRAKPNPSPYPGDYTWYSNTLLYHLSLAQGNPIYNYLYDIYLTLPQAMLCFFNRLNACGVNKVAWYSCINLLEESIHNGTIMK